MFILDTDHLSIADQDTVEGFNLGRRLALVQSADIFVSVITYEEQMRGWLTYIARANTVEQQVRAYANLRLFIDRYQQISLLNYDDQAAAHFERLRQMRVRIGTMDLKIAAIALANDATVLTRNLSDFEKVRGLRVEDWSV